MSELDELDAAEASDPVESGQHGAVARDANVETEAEKYRLLVAEYEAKIEEVSAVIARVRHEINNPLTGVLGQAQLLLREDLNDKARKRAETIEQLAARLRDIVAQLRHVQKPPNS
jgi:signal transduction histidine kinase